MSEYILITDIKKATSDVEWWEEQYTKETDVEFFESFEKASERMRERIANISNSSDCVYPLDGNLSNFAFIWEDEEEEYGGGDDLQLLKATITGILTDPGYEIDDMDGFDIKFTDDGDWYFAFAGNKDIVVADYYGHTLKFNIHNMSDPTKEYFFTYTQSDRDGRETDAVCIRLLSIESPAS